MTPTEVNVAVNEKHKAAMEYVDDAIIARHIRDCETAKRLYRQAYDLENEAALLCPPSQFRHILHYSAASCALSAGMYDEAIAVAERGLSENPPHFAGWRMKKAMRAARWAKKGVFDER